MKKYILLLLLPSLLHGQKTIPAAPDPKPTLAAERTAGLALRKACEDASIVNNVSFRSVGPSVMSGRVVDIDVNPNDPTIFYVAYASGGVWFTNNNGTTFSPVFDKESLLDIGDIAVNWNDPLNPEIWVGTGECNSSRSSYSGMGIYHSADGGKSWNNVGLPESQHIGKVLISPSDPKTVYVAVIGHLFSPNKERGVYKTTDGGLTWRQTLFIDDNTGVIDMFMDPNDSKVMYAIAWHRERKAWNFVEGGTKSGIYKSEDGGEKWNLVTGAGSGFPQGEGVGRIGLNIFPGNTKTMYAIVDNQTVVPDTSKSKDKDLSPLELRSMTKAQFLAMDPARLIKFLKDNNFPEKYNSTVVTQMISDNKILPAALADYISDANSDLFDKPITGAQIYRSDDGGISWKKTNDKNIGNLFYTYGYYFGKIWVNPFDVNELFIAGVELLKSTDGGKTFKSTNGDNQHGDHHALWIDPKRKGHIINGNDGGVNISWDDGATWFKANTPSVGQFYSVNVDMATPYNVYGGLQDNGVWCGASTNHEDLSWYGSGQYGFKPIYDGDGMQVQVDTRDNNTIYAGYQFGHYARIDKTTGDVKELWPEMELGDKPIRFNWQAPIILSTHNMDILYLGAQRLYRSLDKGDHFTPISPDLTRGGKTGDVPYGTLTTIAESSLKFGLIYTGSDDGLIYVSKDGGANWTRISDALPQNMRVNRVIASSHKEGRVYAVLSGMHWDHFKPYLYVSEDYGATWKQLGLKLPMEPLNVVREDPVNENVLFLGSDEGLYLSIDRGVNFMRMNNGLPPVAVHDLYIQTREHDLVVGTHGRSIYIANIREIEALNDSIIKTSLYVFDPAAQDQYSNYDSGKDIWYKSTNLDLSYFSGAPNVSSIKLYSGDGKFLFTTIKDSAEKGLNFYTDEIKVDSTGGAAFKEWAKNNDRKPVQLSHGQFALLPGEYELQIESDDVVIKKKFTINAPKSGGTDAEAPQDPGESGLIDK